MGPPTRSPAVVLGAAGLAVVVAAAVLKAMGSPGARALVRRRLGRWPRLASVVEAVGSSSSTLLGAMPLLAGLGSGILSWGAAGLVLLFALRAMGEHMTAGLSLLVTAVSALAGAVSALPGGLSRRALDDGHAGGGRRPAG